MSIEKKAWKILDCFQGNKGMASPSKVIMSILNHQLEELMIANSIRFEMRCPNLIFKRFISEKRRGIETEEYNLVRETNSRWSNFYN